MPGQGGSSWADSSTEQLSQNIPLYDYIIMTKETFFSRWYNFNVAML